MFKVYYRVFTRTKNYYETYYKNQIMAEILAAQRMKQIKTKNNVSIRKCPLFSKPKND